MHRFFQERNNALNDQTITAKSTFGAKVSDYMQLAKVRLTTSVVISAAAGYLIGAPQFQINFFLLLIAGGFLVVAASNGFNQVIERYQDSVMKRTADRPIAAGRMSIWEGMIASTIFALAGLYLLYTINPLSAGFGALSLFIYTAVYTPLKGVTPLAVFIGAIPGAIPFMLGWVAAMNDFDIESGTLFALQFMWQFPHFWAIAWLLDDEYKKVNYVLLPSGNRDRKSASLTVVYTIWMVLISLAPLSGVTGSLELSYVGAAGVLLLGIFMIYKAIKLFQSLDVSSARKLMFASIIYLPLIQVIYVLDKYF